MFFNSLNFAIFLPIVFLLYWFVAKESLKLKNSLLLIASYFFYGCWDYRFLFLLVFSTLLDYYTGHKIHDANNQKSKKVWLWLSIGINLGFLGVFKYYNFFASSFSEALSQIGIEASFSTLQVILPVGISFYTFHGLSYVIDIYKNRITPSDNFIQYSVFVSFFPLLVAGPIERATHLLPQIQNNRVFDYTKAVDGLKQILWGLFKKIVIADNCARYADMIFENHSDYSGSVLVLGAVFFAFQIYGDFSGYSDIALGTARLFGIELLRNFAFPYFSRDIAEFWRRWHISLSSWFRDYVYIPLGGNQGGTFVKVRNVLIVFLLSGFWHGANWTFIAWGLLNAIYILPLVIFNTNRTNLEIVAKGKVFPSIKEVFAIFITFSLTVFAWIFFRANSINEAFSYVSGIFSSSLFEFPSFPNAILCIPLLIMILLFMIIEWMGREEQYAIAKLFNGKPIAFRWSFYYVMLLVIFVFAVSKKQFIYFQF